jgi:hypothetical protein
LLQNKIFWSYRNTFKIQKIMLKEFKNFIMTGNVIDFAVAVIMAGA